MGEGETKSWVEKHPNTLIEVLSAKMEIDYKSREEVERLNLLLFNQKKIIEDLESPPRKFPEEHEKEESRHEEDPIPAGDLAIGWLIISYFLVIDIVIASAIG